MKALLHIDDNAAWELAIGNAKNLLDYADSIRTDCTVELVANGPAVTMLAESAARKAGIYEPLASLSERVRICACANALRKNQIPAEALPAFVTVVPAGVGELVERQAEGFAYIKP